MKFLIIDQDNDDRLFLTQALERELGKVEYIEIDAARAVLQFFNENQEEIFLQAIFIDVYMHGADGIEIFKEVAHRVRGQQIPIFIYSASLTQELITDLKAQGAAAVILKLFSIEDPRRQIRENIKLFVK